jgi:hypothetical protein
VWVGAGAGALLRTTAAWARRGGKVIGCGAGRWRESDGRRRRRDQRCGGGMRSERARSASAVEPWKEKLVGIFSRLFLENVQGPCKSGRRE